MHSNSGRQLQGSPTAATLNPYRSNSSLVQMPPLVSINDKASHIYAYHNATHSPNNKNKTNTNTNNTINVNNNTHGQQDTNRYSETREKAQTNRVISKKSGKRDEYNRKIQRHPKNNPSKYVYTTKSNKKQQAYLQHPHPDSQLTPGHDLLEHATGNQHEQSFAESVYLDLQEYSSIHKYESGSPYDLEEEDRDYVKYFINNRTSNRYRGPTADSHAISNFTLEDESIRGNTINNTGGMNNNINSKRHWVENNLNSGHDKVPQLISSRLHSPNQAHPTPSPNIDLNDTYNQFLSDVNEDEPQFKVKRIQSSNAEMITPITYQPLLIQDKHNLKDKRNILRKNNSNGEVYKTWVSQQIDQKQKYSAEFNKIDEESDYITESRRDNKINGTNYYEVAKELYEHYFREGYYQTERKYDTQDLSNQKQYSSDRNTPVLQISNRSISPTSPQWVQQKSTQNILRLILVKRHRLDQFLNHNRQLQIYMKNLHEKQQLTKLGNRQDIIHPSQEQKQEEQPSHIKVYYDTDPQQPKLTTKNKDKTQENLINYGSQVMPQAYPDRTKKQSNIINRSNVNVNVNYPFSTAFSTISVKSQALKQSQRSKQGYKPKVAVQLAGSGVGSSDYVTSLNVFGIPRSNATKKDRKQLYSIYSQMDAQSEYNKANSVAVARKPILGMQGKRKSIQILQILQLLLVKLSGKKCNVFVKQPTVQGMNMNSASSPSNAKDNAKININININGKSPNKLQNMALSSVSKRSNANTIGQAINSRDKGKDQDNDKYKDRYDGDLSNNQKITKIQFQQYTHPDTAQNDRQMPIPPNQQQHQQQHIGCSKKLQTYSQRIKQLNLILEQKDRYIEQVKAQYDYVINNYINSIANLKTMQSVDDSTLPTVLRGLNVGGSRYKEGYESKDASAQDSAGPKNNKYAYKQQYQEQKYGRKKMMHKQEVRLGGNRGLDMSDDEDSQLVVKRRQELSRQKREKQAEMERQRQKQRGEQPIQNIRLSQPMTFQMSITGNDNSREQQWIGHPGNPEPEVRAQNNSDHAALRRSSLPSKQDQHLIKHHKSKQHLLF